MRSKFAVMGHPLHPALVAVPIGLFGWALVSDFIYLGTGKDHMWYDIAFWTGIAAWCSALIAALPGFGDYFTIGINSDARAMGAMHMLLNLTVVALFFIATLLMLDDNAVDGAQFTVVLVLHIVGVGLLALSGWLGGEMVFRHHLAIVPDDADLARAEYEHHETRHGQQPARGSR
jgi:uncharacterized membrane protein